MTQIEVMLNNIYMLGMRAGGGLLGVWGLYIFFKSLFGEGGRNPVRIVVSVLMIVAAGAMFQLLPKLVEIGKDTGSQLSGGGGYSMPAPAGIDTTSLPGLTVPAAL